jgi:hypothetical protein
MKKTMLAMMILAGLSLLVGILMKLGAVPHIMGTVPSSWVQMTVVFLLAAIALGVYGKKDQ